MLFVEVLDAVEAVLEMVLAIVYCGCPVNVLQEGSVAPEGSVALPAKSLRALGATVWDEAAPCGVSAPSRRAALWAEALASVSRRVRVLC